MSEFIDRILWAIPWTRRRKQREIDAWIKAMEEYADAMVLTVPPEYRDEWKRMFWEEIG